MSTSSDLVGSVQKPTDKQSSVDTSAIQKDSKPVVWTFDSYPRNPGLGSRGRLTDPTVIDEKIEFTIPGGSYRIVWRGDGGYIAQGEVSYPSTTGSFTIRGPQRDHFNPVTGVSEDHFHRSTEINLDNISPSLLTEDRLDSLNLVIYTPEGQVLSGVQPEKETWESLGIEVLLSGARDVTTLMIQTPEGYTFRVQTDPDAEAGTSPLISLEQDLLENDPSGGTLRLDEGGSLAVIKRDPLTGVQFEEFFDADFYLASNPDVADEVANGGMSDPLTHFQRHGQYEGRNPNAFFDTAFYLASNPDVAAEVAEGLTESAVHHFLNYGQFDWRSPNPGYSDLAYLVRNPDVVQDLASGEFTTPVAHFLQVGQAQGFSAVPLA
ncbi:hypothetical protein [Sodalinema gerasimenkoae]|uniref:hypothetical protein n=1 Tax=Sodalinema gerasimenkoae TaxID=2862348 RepID=UPI001357C6B4|nr:hypothetical protein [Sodalinema gerasimenkoae]